MFQLCYLIVSCWVYFNSKPLAFNIENARNSTCGTAITSSSRIRIGTRTTAVTGSAVTTDNRNCQGGVSYHTGIETVETVISKSAGVHFGKLRHFKSCFTIRNLQLPIQK